MPCALFVRRKAHQNKFQARPFFCLYRISLYMKPLHMTSLIQTDRQIYYIIYEEKKGKKMNLVSLTKD